MPVLPRTFGLRQQTFFKPSRPKSCFNSLLKCRVASTLSATNGPNESGVISVLPSPTTSAFSVLPQTTALKAFTVAFIMSEVSLTKSRRSNSTVQYVPTGFCKMRAAFLSVSFTVDILTLPTVSSLASAPFKFSFASSLISAIRSVLMFIQSPQISVSKKHKTLL